MAVAHDASSVSAEFTTGSPATWTHTPVGTPRGVVVLIGGANNGDEITGVTYGGVTMQRVSFADLAAGETGSGFAYFLGSGVPAGAQTVSVAHLNTAGLVKRATATTVTADQDTEVADVFEVVSTSAVPRVTLDTGAKVGLRLFGGFTGNGNTPGMTPLANTTEIAETDFGLSGLHFVRETSPSAGATEIGYADGAEDAAFACVAVVESDPPPPQPEPDTANRIGGTGAIRRPPRR